MVDDLDHGHGHGGVGSSAVNAAQQLQEAELAIQRKTQDDAIFKKVSERGNARECGMGVG